MLLSGCVLVCTLQKLILNAHTRQACPEPLSVLQDVHLCKQCGWAHVCGPNCTERIMDTVTGLPVCPISGTCFDQMMTAWEVRVCKPLCLGVCAAWPRMAQLQVPGCGRHGGAWTRCRCRDVCCVALNGPDAHPGMCAAGPCIGCVQVFECVPHGWHGFSAVAWIQLA